LWVASGRRGGGGETSSNISSLHRQKFARKTRDFVRAYDAGATVGTVDALRKLLKECRQRYVFKHHRGICTGGGILD
jgi:hypothetical protein